MLLEKNKTKNMSVISNITRDINNMKCIVFDMAVKRWKLTPSLCVKEFDKYKIFELIEKSYDLFHQNGYNYIMDDIDMYIKEKNGKKIRK